MKPYLLVFMILIAGAAPSESAGVRVDVTPIRVVQVNSLDALQKALAAAAPGDQIVLANGVYTADDAITINRAGSADHPIVVMSQSIGGAEIKGKAGFTFGESAAYAVVQGFKFTHSCVSTKLPVGTHNLRVTRNVFALQTDNKAPEVIVYGDDCEIDHNTFQDKHTEGCMITVQGPGGSGMAQWTWIHHNYFNNFQPTANNCSAIQIGLSGRSLSSTNSLVEYNLFVKCRGENEGGVCNKSCDNTYRFNTFGEGTTELSLRHGNGCRVYANYFIGSDGVRFFGHDHRIFSNYFERCRTAITIGNGDGIVPKDKLTSHDKPVGVAVVFNTLVNNQKNIQMLGRNNGLGAAEITVANNVIVGGSKAATIGGTIEKPTWEGNIVWNTSGGAGDIPADGFAAVDPSVRKSAAVGTFDFVTVDINGHPRGAKKEAGADQSGSVKAINRILTDKDVGPNAHD